MFPIAWAEQVWLKLMFHCENFYKYDVKHHSIAVFNLGITCIQQCGTNCEYLRYQLAYFMVKNKYGSWGNLVFKEISIKPHF